MKKLFLVILAAGLFVACGNTNGNKKAEEKDKNATVEAPSEEGKQKLDSVPNVDDMGDMDEDMNEETNEEVA